MLNNKLCQLAFRNRVLTVTGLPTLHAMENVQFKPVVGQSWLEENYVPATGTLFSGPASGGMVEETGLSIWKWYEPDNTGFVTISNGTDAILALFTPGTTLSLSDGTTVRVRGDAIPRPGQILPDGKGWVYRQVTIPWRAYTTNTIAP